MKENSSLLRDGYRRARHAVLRTFSPTYRGVYSCKEKLRALPPKLEALEASLNDSISDTIRAEVASHHDAQVRPELDAVKAALNGSMRETIRQEVAGYHDSMLRPELEEIKASIGGSMCEALRETIRQEIAGYHDSRLRPELDALKASVQQIVREELFASRDAARGVEVVKDILACSDEEFRNPKYIASQLKRFGLANYDWGTWGEFLSWRNNSMFGVLQYPPEFIEFVMYVASLGISSVAEVGVMFGGSSYFMAAMLQRANPDISYLMIDIADQLFNYNDFAKYLNIKKCIPCTSQDFAGKEFDFVFIDADHSYEGMIGDFRVLGQYAKKCVAFHDIYAHETEFMNGGVPRAWREIKESYGNRYETIEFARCPIEWMGIGLAVRKRKDEAPTAITANISEMADGEK